MNCKSKVESTKNVHVLVLGELRERADTISKVVLSAFKCCAKDEANVDTLSSSTYSRPHLSVCAKFLGIQNTDDKKLYKTKVVIAERIVRKVKSLFSSTCGSCSELYRHSLTAETQPLATCHRCLRGSHDCEAFKEKMEPVLALDRVVGTVWLCQDCLPLVAAVPTPIIAAVTKVDATQEVVKEHAELPADDEDEESDVEVLEEKENEEENSEGKDVLKDSQKGWETMPPNKRSDTCNKYRHGNCPHGLNGNKLVNGVKCSKPHPHVCWSWRRSGNNKGGCSRGKNCKFFHPKICKASANRQRCDLKSCTLIHLKMRKSSPPPHQARPNRGSRPMSTTIPNMDKQRKDTKLNLMGAGGEDFHKALQSQQDQHRKEIESLRDLISQMKPFQPPALYPLQWPQVGTAPQGPAMSPSQTQFLAQMRSLLPTN